MGKIIAHPAFQDNSTTNKLPKLLDQVREKLRVTRIGSALTLPHFISASANFRIAQLTVM